MVSWTQQTLASTRVSGVSLSFLFDQSDWSITSCTRVRSETPTRLCSVETRVSARVPCKNHLSVISQSGYTPVRPSSRPYYVINRFFLENADSRRKDANDLCLKYPNFGSPSHRNAFVLRLHCVPTAIIRRPNYVLVVSTASCPAKLSLVTILLSIPWLNWLSKPVFQVPTMWLNWDTVALRLATRIHAVCNPFFRS